MIDKLKVKVFVLVTFLYAFPALALGPSGQPVELNNPLQVGTITELLNEILKIFITIATPLVIFFIIYAGFMYVTARGNPAEIEKAHRAITYALIGGVLIIGAVAIGQIIKNLVDKF